MKEIIKYHYNGMIHYRCFEDDAGQIQGKYYLYYENGLPRSVSEYKDGCRLYTTQTWYSNGNIEEVSDRTVKVGNLYKLSRYNSYGHITETWEPDTSNNTVKVIKYCGTALKVAVQEYTADNDGHNVGLYTARFNTGFEKEATEYCNGMKNGKSVQWHESYAWENDKVGQGEPRRVQSFVATYKNNLLEGEVNEYHKNGNLYRNYFITRGTRNGHYTEYSTTGVLTLSANYVSGSIKGEEKRYSPATGNLVLHRIFDEENHLTEEHKYHPDGTPEESVHWEYKRFSRFYKEIKRYTKGVLVYHTTYDNSIPNKTSYSESTYNHETSYRVSLTESKHTNDSKVSLKFHYSVDGKPKRISLVVNDQYQTTDFKKLLKKKTSEITDADIAYIKLAYF